MSTTPISKHADLIVVGAGIVGAAVARAYLTKFPSHKVILLDKEPQSARHQTGRNSGVIHAGVYYTPGSLKSRYCREGLERTIAFCKQFGVPFEQCGKIIVATNTQECERLQTLFDHCQKNDLSPQRISQQRLNEMEPAITGQEGIWVKHTGITDYAQLTSCLIEQCQAYSGFSLALSAVVTQIKESGDSVTLEVEQGDKRTQIKADKAICCAGLMSDKLIRNQGLDCDFKILPFRGEYYKLSSKFDGITKRLIYPVPDPSMPFLGVHLTKMIGGYTTVGPNAVLASGREAYDGFSFSVYDWWDSLSFKGLYSLLWQYKGAVMKELKTSLSARAYAKEVQKYCPSVQASDFMPYRSGIRAQAVKRDGSMMHDFHFVQSERVVHVANAPSPAATSAFPIADSVLQKLL